MDVLNRLQQSSGAGGNVPSVVGAKMGDVGGVDFTQDGKFGKSASRLVISPGGKRLTQTFNYSGALTVEVWFRPNYPSTSTVTYYLLDFRNNGLSLIINNSSTLGLIFYPPNVTNTGSIQLAYGHPTAFSAGDLIHLAFVIDSNTIPGLGGAYSALYWNGVRATKTGGVGSESTPVYAGSAAVTDGIIMCDRTSAVSLNGGIDNFKIHNYAKTNFSDRFQERGGLHDQIMVG
jgi:hypothetical protein